MRHSYQVEAVVACKNGPVKILYWQAPLLTIMWTPTHISVLLLDGSKLLVYMEIADTVLCVWEDKEVTFLSCPVSDTTAVFK